VGISLRVFLPIAAPSTAKRATGKCLKIRVQSRIPKSNIRNFTNRWTKRQGWDIVINQLMLLFGDRLKPDLVDAL
jgi:hypothetical protein